MRPLLMLAMGLAVLTAGCDRLPWSGDRDQKTASGARGAPDFGGVEIVEVEAEGAGPTRNAALLDALNLAVRQTNGSPIEGVTQNLNGSLALGGKSGDFGVTLDNVSAVTRGAVKGFEIVRERDQAESWRVTVKVKVARFREPAAAAMPKVAVAAPRIGSGSFQIGDQTLSAREAGASVRAALADAIGQSNRFFVINRDFDQALDAEAANITSGSGSGSGSGDPADLVRLGQRLTADIIIVPDIRRLEYRKSSRTLRFSGRELRSYAGGADIAFDVVNVATGQLILSKRYKVEFPATPPTVLGSQKVDGGQAQELLAELADQFTREFIQKTFPISVIKLDGALVTLSQGEAYLQAGQTYDVVSLGDVITDPQTGQSLGRAELPAGKITVTRTLEKISIGNYQGGFPAARFKPGVLELRPAAAAPPSNVATNVVAAPPPGDAPPPVEKRASSRPPHKIGDAFNAEFDF